MPTTYEKAGRDVTDLLLEVMGEFHAELGKEDVKVGVIFANNSEGAAVKKGGYPCAGKISIVSLKDRCEKSYDAELIIDQTWWTEGREKHHRALIDHELSHLELVPDEEEGGERRPEHEHGCGERKDEEKVHRAAAAELVAGECDGDGAIMGCGCVAGEHHGGCGP